MLDVGDPAPDFDLDGTAGAGFGSYRLSAATDRVPVLVAFYTEDFAPACAGYLEALRDADWGALTDGIGVFGVAPGTMASHREFATELDLPFPLLVDDPGVDAQFGVQRPDGTTRRSAFLVDRRVRVAFRWVDEREAPDTAPDVDPILDAVGRL